MRWSEGALLDAPGSARGGEGDAVRDQRGERVRDPVQLGFHAGSAKERFEMIAFAPTTTMR